MTAKKQDMLVGACIFILLISLIDLLPAQAAWALPTSSPPPPPSFFPLNVGNVWRYRCGTEGEAHFEKTIAVVSLGTSLAGPYFKLEQRVRDKKLTFYLISDVSGNILRSLSSDAKKARIIAAHQMKVGEIYGEDRATREQVITTPATGSVTALVVENFNPDDSGLSQEKRNEWHGRFFVKGVGLVSEGDGLGGDCTLIKYQIK
jgi:hypothetical protein